MQGPHKTPLGLATLPSCQPFLSSPLVPSVGSLSQVIFLDGGPTPRTLNHEPNRSALPKVMSVPCGNASQVGDVGTLRGCSRPAQVPCGRIWLPLTPCVSVLCSGRRR